jgi:pimeloyl-ACP methyl ester carboxylesterase
MGPRSAARQAASSPPTSSARCSDRACAAPIDDLILFGRHWGFELRNVKVPITFYGGSSDIIVPYVHAERQSKRVHGSRLRTIEGSGHFAGYTDPAQVLDDVREHWPI